MKTINFYFVLLLTGGLLLAGGNAIAASLDDGAMYISQAGGQHGSQGGAMHNDMGEPMAPPQVDPNSASGVHPPGTPTPSDIRGQQDSRPSQPGSRGSDDFAPPGQPYSPPTGGHPGAGAGY